MIRRITNLFKQSNLNIAFRETNIIQQQQTEKQTSRNPSGIYKLVCNTCNNVYVGQSVSSLNVRRKEHVRYIRTNNPFFDVLLTVHLSIFISVINQLDAQNFCFTISFISCLYIFEHMCSSSGGQNCITQPLVSSYL